MLVIARHYGLNRGVEGDFSIGQDALDVFQFCSKQRQNPILHRAAVHFLCTLAKGKVDLSLIGSKTMDLILLCLFDECMEVL